MSITTLIKYLNKIPGIEYHVARKDGGLVTINFWVGDDQ